MMVCVVGRCLVELWCLVGGCTTMLGRRLVAGLAVTGGAVRPTPVVSSTVFGAGYSTFAPGPSLHMPSSVVLSARHGVNLKEVSGTGPRGAVLKGDILAFLGDEKAKASIEREKMVSAEEAAKLAGGIEVAAGSSSAKQGSKARKSGSSGSRSGSVPSHANIDFVARPGGGGYSDLGLNQMRSAIAARLTECKQTIPHTYATAVVDMTAVTALRAEIKAETGERVTANDFVVAAVAKALAAVPAVNCVWEGSKLVVSPTVDVSVAVAIDDGLITPIVSRANERGLLGISAAIRELAGKAKEGKLAPHEFQGGSFTVSNLGGMGVSAFTAVINPPQAAILSVGAAVGRAVPAAPGSATAFDVVYDASVTLNYDARAIHEGDAAAFLEVLGDKLKEPTTLLL